MLNQSNSTFTTNSQPNDLTQKINLIYPIFLSALTTIGNGLSFLVFNSATFKNTVTGFFFKYKSLADTLNVYIGTLRFTYLSVTGHDPKDTSPFLCYMFNFGVYEIDSVCSWFSVLVSLDRLFLVLRPSKYSSMSTPGSHRFQAYSLLITLGILTCINLFKNIQTYYDWTIRPLPKCSVASSMVFDAITLTITVVVPFFLMIVSSSFIAHSLIKSKQKLTCNPSGVIVHQNKKEEKSKGFVKTVLCLDACFLVFNTPRLILQLVKSNTLTYVLALQFSTILKYSYYSLTIVLYATTNSLFRAKLMGLFASMLKVCSSLSPNHVTHHKTTRVHPKTRFS